MLLRQQHTCYNTAYIATLDIAKVFDSISHRALSDTLKSYGLPSPFTEYLTTYYKHSTTAFKGNGWDTPDFTPTWGVKQGDPLYPYLFNIVIDRLIKTYPIETGCMVGSSRVNCLAFAEDLILCAQTPVGLQSILDSTVSFLKSYGLSINAAKCKSIALRA